MSMQLVPTASCRGRRGDAQCDDCTLRTPGGMNATHNTQPRLQVQTFGGVTELVCLDRRTDSHALTVRPEGGTAPSRNVGPLGHMFGGAQTNSSEVCK
jgi:hypothetical protein